MIILATLFQILTNSSMPSWIQSVLQLPCWSTASCRRDFWLSGQFPKRHLAATTELSGPRNIPQPQQHFVEYGSPAGCEPKPLWEPTGGSLKGISFNILGLNLKLLYLVPVSPTSRQSASLGWFNGKVNYRTSLFQENQFSFPAKISFIQLVAKKQRYCSFSGVFIFGMNIPIFLRGICLKHKLNIYSWSTNQILGIPGVQSWPLNFATPLLQPSDCGTGLAEMEPWRSHLNRTWQFNWRTMSKKVEKQHQKSVERPALGSVCLPALYQPLAKK